MGIHNKITAMKKRSHKEMIKNNYDYLNFIRRNQQIVKEFKELTKPQRKGEEMKKTFDYINQEKASIEINRYSQPPLYFQDRVFNYKNQARHQVISMKEGFQCESVSETDFPIKLRKDTDLTERIGKSEMYYRQLKLLQKPERQPEYQKIPEVVSQVKFPKLMGKASLHDQSPQGRSNSQSSLSAEKQLLTPKRNRLNKDRMNLQNWRKNYAPASVQNYGNASKAQNSKFIELNKNKINDKLVRTYCEIENVAELKERVAELLPTFKPAQKKKVHVQKETHQELQYYLESNMIMMPQARAIYNPIKKNSNHKIPAGRWQNYEEDNSDVEEVGKLRQQTDPECLIIENQILDRYQNLDYDKNKSQKQTLQKHTLSLQNSPLKSRVKKEKEIKMGRYGNINGTEQTVYQNKIQSYRQFLFLVNFAHRVFDPLIIRQDPERHKIQNKYTYYIGPGNNGLLLKSLMKRRYWWTPVDDPKNANFVWTQLKVNSYFQLETKNKLGVVYDKLDSQYMPLVYKKKLVKSKASINQGKKVEAKGGILRAQLPEGEKKIFTRADSYYLAQMLEKAAQENPQFKNFNKFETRLKYLPDNFLRRREQNYAQIRMHNHLECNYEIGNKKALFYNLKHYYQITGSDAWQSIPLTFHIQKGINDPQYTKFIRHYKHIKRKFQSSEPQNRKKQQKNIWIVKPGQLSNRGNGITVIDQIYQLNSILKSKDKHNSGIQKTYIIQKYIERPMLYRNRKFDIRHYMAITNLYGRMRGYWFSEGYIRTSSYEYDIEEVGDLMVHLTNDAIQKHGVSYGKYEEGNKLSYSEFQRYLDNTYPEKKYSFIDSIYPRMRQIATDAVKATFMWMDPQRLQHNFQVFGLDFMIDSNFNVWLIEVNTNPCLEISSSLLGRIIPTMIENSLRLALDPIFPPPAHYLNTIKYLAPDSPMERLQFQLIFDESRDGKEVEELLTRHGKANSGVIEEEDETYENDGKEIELGGDLE